MCIHNPKDWSRWLPLAEWWWNTHYHSATKLTPYEVVYNQPPPLHLPYLPGEVVDKDLDRTLQRRENMIAELKQQLLKAQSRMKHQADKNRSDRVFAIGDWVWLKLVPYKQRSIQWRSNTKLSPKYYGPFQVLNTIGKASYKLQLPLSAKIHDVFHVSQLKSFKGVVLATVDIPTWLTSDKVPLLIITKRMRDVNNVAKIEYLVHWQGQSADQATWEDDAVFLEKFPHIPVP